MAPQENKWAVKHTKTHTLGKNESSKKGKRGWNNPKVAKQSSKCGKNPVLKKTKYGMFKIFPTIYIFGKPITRQIEWTINQLLTLNVSKLMSIQAFST